MNSTDIAQLEQQLLTLDQIRGEAWKDQVITVEESMTKRISAQDFKALVLRRDAYWDHVKGTKVQDRSPTAPNRDALDELRQYMCCGRIWSGENLPVDPKGIDWLIRDDKFRGMLDAESLMHPDAPEETLWWVWEGNHAQRKNKTDLAYWLSGNPSCPDDLLHEMVQWKKMKSDALQQIAKHPNVSERTLKAMLGRKNLQVRAESEAKSRLLNILTGL